MSEEIETVSVPVEQRKRRPIPIFEDRFTQREQYSREIPYIDLSKPYLRKNILAEIGNNLNELVEIKTGGKFIDSVIEEKKIEKLVIEKPVIEEKKINTKKVEEKIEQKIEPIIIMSPETIKIDDKNNIKVGMDNLEIINIVPDKKLENKDLKIELKQFGTKQSENKEKLVENKKKIIKRKVNYMSEELENVNISPELRKSMRKAEFKEYQDEEDLNKEIRKSAELATKNQREIENLKSKLDENKIGIQKELNTKFGNLDNKFGNLDIKFSEIGKKLDETCTGIECLKKDIKKQELVECPECGKERVPHLASFCPECGAKMYAWTDDNGTPIKNWRPNWKQI